MVQADIGMIGLGVMGSNLALNMEEKGFTVAVYDVTRELFDRFMNGPGQGKKFIGSLHLYEFCRSLKTPRLVMMMIPAGAPVDDMIAKLIPLLEKGDVIIDGGNSQFRDTVRRMWEVEQDGLLYVGTGISGGAEGARHGPSIMPGGSLAAWELIRPIFEKIAAVAPDGTPCCRWIGKGGAGHFVKMVHNGIEYADMQMISEAYFIMARLFGLEPKEMSRIFARWNQTELQSYLIEITAIVLDKKDPETGRPMVDIIQDRAGQKGTGAWTSEVALSLGIPVPTIAEAVFARSLSSDKDERLIAAKILGPPKIEGFSGDQDALTDKLMHALYVAKICAYAQGFAMMRQASKEYDWDLNLENVAAIWRAGCIIRAAFLDSITEAFAADPDLPNILFAPYFKNKVLEHETDLRDIIALAVENGLPVPAYANALSYLDSYRTERLPANLIQALRDYFGAHTFERIDHPGFIHVDWDTLEDL